MALVDRALTGTLYVSAEVPMAFNSASGNGYSWSITIPNQSGLRGLNFYQQAFATDGSANALAVIHSRVTSVFVS